MKNVFKKFLVLSAVISLAFTGCNDIADFGGSNEENATVHAAGKAVLSLSVNQNSARTIMPTNISEADVTQIELTAKKIGSDGKETEYMFQLEEASLDNMVQWSSEDGKTAIENMQDSSVTIDCGTYNFTLKLYTGDAGAGSLRITQEATLENQTITAETTSLEFEAKYVDKGDLSLTIQFDSDFDIDKRIGAVKAGLFTMASKGKDVVTGYDYEALSIIENAASYIEYDVPNGTYYVKFLIYSPVTVDEESGESKSGELLNTISEIVKIHGYKTEKTINIANEDLNALYSVSYNLNNEKVAWKEDVEDGLTTKRNIYTGITLPVKDDIKCSGWKLLGWYEVDVNGIATDTDDDGNPKIITTIGTGKDTGKDYTLYAKWEKEEANVEFDVSIKVDESSDITADYEIDAPYVNFTVTLPDNTATYTYSLSVDEEEQTDVNFTESEAGSDGEEEAQKVASFTLDGSDWTTGVYDVSLIVTETKTDSASGETATNYYSYLAQIEWTRLYTVTFDMTGAPDGTETVKPVYIAENAETKTITAPTDVTPTFGWYTDSEFTEEFDFTSDVTKSMTLYGCWDLGENIYVSENGTDGTDRGTIGRPLASISDAVALMTDSDVDYTVWVEGTISGGDTITSSATAHSITLIGKNGVDSKNEPKDSLNGGFSETKQGRTLTVSTTVPVTIENLVVTGGYLTDSGSFGGGLYVGPNATVTLAGATKITDNTAQCGGGVDVDGTLTMKDEASIYDNIATALYGGGVHVGSSGVLDMQAGSIYGNDISGTPAAGEEKQGYGVYVSGSDGRLKMGGSAIVGSSDDNVPNDVYLASGTKIIITKQLMGGVTTATITPAYYDTTTQWLEAAVVDEKPVVELDVECSSFAVTPSGTTNYVISSTGTLTIAPFYVSETGDDETGDGSSRKPFATIAKAVSKMTSSVDYTIYVDGTLTGAQTIAKTDSINATSITLCGLNGLDEENNNEPKDVLNGGSDGTTLTIDAAKVTIKNLKITGGYAENGGGINASNWANLTIQDGTLIAENTATKSGGGIYSNLSYFTMAGGEISGNSVTGSADGAGGGGICIAGGLGAQGISMTGGTISGNDSSKDGGGVYIGGKDSFSMTGGTIIDNTADGKGSGVYVAAMDSTSTGSYSLSMGASALIASNNDVYLSVNTGNTYQPYKVIYLLSSLTSETTPVATITPESYTAGNAVLANSQTPASSTSVSAEYTKFAVTPQIADDGNGGTTTTAWKTTAEGKLAVKLGDKASPTAVGDIVFNDGTALAYTDGMTLCDNQKSAAIAVIFYVGTGLNSDVDGVADTTTSRTLGVGLKHHRSGLAWCLDSANAYSKNITTIQCNAVGSVGDLTFTGDKNGSDNLSQISDFLSAADSGTTDDTAIEENYPAFYFAKDYKTLKIGYETESRITADSDYADGWYLPSLAELFQIYANGKGANKVFDIDAASEALGGDRFETSPYRSSSQCDSIDNSAWALTFSNGARSYDDKNYASRYVCAIREF